MCKSGMREGLNIKPTTSMAHPFTVERFRLQIDKIHMLLEKLRVILGDYVPVLKQKHDIQAFIRIHT